MGEKPQRKFFEINDRLQELSVPEQTPPQVTPHGRFISSFYLGVEVELEGMSEEMPKQFMSGSSCGGWRMVPDGSLRNGGGELVFRTPARNNTAFARLELLTSWRKQYGAWTESERTSVHVHLDCRALTVVQIRAICAAYALVEPLLFMYVAYLAPEYPREKSVFCIPWYRAPDDPLRLARCLHGLTVADSNSWFRLLRQLKVDQCKYMAVNSGSLHKFGSLEFRHAAVLGSLSAYVDWINAIQCIGMFGIHLATPERVLYAYRKFGHNKFANLVFSKSRVTGSGLNIGEYIELADKLDVEALAQAFGEEETPTAGSWGHFAEPDMSPVSLREAVDSGASNGLEIDGASTPTFIVRGSPPHFRYEMPTTWHTQQRAEVASAEPDAIQWEDEDEHDDMGSDEQDDDEYDEEED